MTNQDKQIQAHVFISGMVQGVGYRWNTQRQANKLGLTGWVRNLRDGRVEAVFEGEESTVRDMVQWCHTGAPSARVDDVDVDYEDATGKFRSFNIKH